jgi:hypothetical protein
MRGSPTARSAFVAIGVSAAITAGSAVAASAIGQPTLTYQQGWVKAIQPAAARGGASTPLKTFPGILACLDKLTSMANREQVDNCLPYVAALVDPIMSQLPLTSPPYILEHIGPPSITENGNTFDCHGGPTMFSPAPPRKMKMAGMSYVNGFQFVTDSFSVCVTTHVDTYTWRIGTKFAAFHAIVGLNESDSTSTTLTFVGVVGGKSGKDLPFTYDGSKVTSVALKGGVPSTLTLNLSGQTSLEIRLTTGDPTQDGNRATVDFASDSLSL